MAARVTLLDVFEAVSQHARSEAETVATVVHLINAGHVRLGGALAGARVDLGGVRQVRGEAARSAYCELRARAVA